MNKSTTEQNDEYDFKFASSLFLSNEYAIRHLLLLDDINFIFRECSKAKKIIISEMECNRYVVEAVLDYIFYMRPEFVTQAFSTLFWERCLNKCELSHMSIDDITNFYNNLLHNKDEYNIFKYLCQCCIQYGIYITDLIFLTSRDYQFPITTPNLLKNSLELIPTTKVIDKIQKSILFIDSSNLISEIAEIDGKKADLFHAFFMNFNDHNFNIHDSLLSIKTIYTFYQLTMVIDNGEPHKFMDAEVASAILPERLKRLNLNEIKTKIDSLRIWDLMHLENLSLKEAIKECYPDKKNDIRSLEFKLKNPIELANRCIKTGKICRTNG